MCNQLPLLRAMSAALFHRLETVPLAQSGILSAFSSVNDVGPGLVTLRRTARGQVRRRNG